MSDLIMLYRLLFGLGSGVISPPAPGFNYIHQLYFIHFFRQTFIIIVFCFKINRLNFKFRALCAPCQNLIFIFLFSRGNFFMVFKVFVLRDFLTPCKNDLIDNRLLKSFSWPIEWKLIMFF